MLTVRRFKTTAVFTALAILLIVRCGLTLIRLADIFLPRVSIGRYQSTMSTLQGETLTVDTVMRLRIIVTMISR